MLGVTSRVQQRQLTRAEPEALTIGNTGAAISTTFSGGTPIVLCVNNTGSLAELRPS